MIKMASKLEDLLDYRRGNFNWRQITKATSFGLNMGEILKLLMTIKSVWISKTFQVWYGIIVKFVLQRV